MRWIGQNIYDLISRFRSDVYLEDISAGTIADGGNLGLDTAGKIVKAGVLEGDLTSIIAGTGLSGTSLTGPIPTLNVDASIPSITTLAGLTSFGAAAGDVTMYNAVNDGNPTISLGSSATNRLEMVSTYDSGAQTLDSVSFNSYTTSIANNDGKYFWRVDENLLMALLDAGLTVYGNVFVGADGASITSQNTTASSATEGGKLVLRCDDGAAMADNHRLGVVEFSGAEDASNNRQTGARIQAMCDAGWSASENGTRLEFYTMDGNASSELSLTLDSDLLATFAGGVAVTGTITGDVTGDLTGNADTVTTIAGLAPNTATTQASQPNITGVGTIGTGVWQGTTIKTDYIGDDQITEDKLANTLLAEIDANTAKVTNVTTNLSGTTATDTLRINSSDGTNYIIAEASGSIAGLMTVTHHDKLDGIEASATADQTKSDIDGLAITTVGTVDTGVWNGTAIAHAYIGADAIETDNIADAQVTVAKLHADAVQTSGESFADNDTSVMTSAAINDAIIKGGNITTIKVLPYQFMQNEDGGVNKSVQFDASGTLGVRSSSPDGELFAFVEIPFGKTATNVTVHGSDTNNVVQVYELDINASAALGGTDGSGNNKTNASGCVVGTACDIVDVASDATNYLVIEVTVTATTDIVYGASVTISG